VRIAAISDIHGNVGALKAVLVDIGRRVPDLIVNLGDSLSGPLFPAECADLLLALGIPTIRGNHERQLLTLGSEEMSESDRYAALCLGPEHVRWMQKLPETLLVLDEVLLVHGTPESDVCYFLETVEAAGVREALPSEVQQRAGAALTRVILCGHSHIPRIYELSDRSLIINPGSVGLPAYEDYRPFPHKMQSGSPHARYAIVEKGKESWSAELCSVVYDWESAAKAAESRQRADWARALRTGFA
jgi:predicted phosphodiesterase